MIYEMGTPVFEEDGKAYFRVEREGCILNSAPTGYGKSIILKHQIMAENKEKDYILIIDYRGEHIDVKYPNCESETPDCIEDLNVVSNIGFYISDFSKGEYWSGLGYPPGASRALGKLASKYELHQDDPDIFYELIRELPTEMSGEDSVHKASKQSMLDRFDSRVFISPEEEDVKNYVSNWGEYLTQFPKTLINLNLESEDNTIARCFIGIIFDQLRSYIVSERITPIAIFIEEADLLCPSDEPVIPYSLHVVSEYSLKLQRHGIRLYMVTQHMANLADSIRSNVRMYFLGRLFAEDVLGKLTSSLRWDRQIGYREFLMYDNGSLKLKFIPYVCPCLYHKRE